MSMQLKDFIKWLYRSERGEVWCIAHPLGHYAKTKDILLIAVRGVRWDYSIEVKA